MGTKKRIMFFAAIVFHLFLHFPSQTEANGAELVSEVCKLSQNYKSCFQILVSDPRTMKAPNAKAIAKIGRKLARKDAIDTSKFFTGLAHTNPASKAALETGASYFKEAVIFLNLRGLKEGSASYDVHNAIDQANYCLNALSSGHVHLNSATARIQKWTTVYSVADVAVQYPIFII